MLSSTFLFSFASFLDTKSLLSWTVKEALRTCEALLAFSVISKVTSTPSSFYLFLLLFPSLLASLLNISSFFCFYAFHYSRLLPLFPFSLLLDYLLCKFSSFPLFLCFPLSSLIPSSSFFQALHLFTCLHSFQMCTCPISSLLSEIAREHINRGSLCISLL